MVKGLKEWPRQDRRQVAIPFFAFRVVVGIGLAMLAIVAWSLWLRWRGQLAVSPSFLWVCQWVSPLGFIAVLADWITTEVGGGAAMDGLRLVADLGFGVTITHRRQRPYHHGADRL